MRDCVLRMGSGGRSASQSRSLADRHCRERPGGDVCGIDLPLQRKYLSRRRVNDPRASARETALLHEWDRAIQGRHKPTSR